VRTGAARSVVLYGTPPTTAAPLRMRLATLVTRRADLFGATAILLLLAACSGGSDTPTAPRPGGNPPVNPAPVTPGTLGLVVTGVPAGANADIAVSGTGTNASFARTATGTTSWADVAPGRYTIAARPLRTSLGQWVAAPASVDVDIAAGSASLTGITYRPLPSVITVTATGLPEGATPVVFATPPRGQAAPVSVPATIAAPQLEQATTADAWQLRAESVTSGGAVYAPVPAALDTTVLFGDTARFTVRYGVASGAIAVAVAGLPNGTAANVQVIGPDNAVTPVGGTTTLTGLTPGKWRVVAQPVTRSGVTWRPVRDTLHLDVVASLVAAPAPVVYEAQIGRAAIVVNGLPADVPALVTLTGGGQTRPIAATTTFDSLPAGTYTLSAQHLVAYTGTANATRYLAAPATQQFTVAANQVSTGTITYTAVPTAVVVTVNGLPQGTPAALTLTSPSGSTTAVTASQVLSPVSAGRWRWSAAPVPATGGTYQPSSASGDVTIAPGDTLRISTTYSLVGTLNYNIAGVYLTQATQRFDGSVPLVSGREALLRVFVTASGANSARPDVRVRLFDGATQLQTTTIAAPEASVRTSVAEGVLNSTWNLLVPASAVRPTLRVQVELDPAQAIADGNRADNTWPASGTQAITVQDVPPFTVRFVPVTVGALTGNVSTTNANQFLTDTRRQWPLRDVVTDVRATFTSAATALQANDTNGDWLTVLSEINALRTADGAPNTTHYYGVVKVNYNSGIAGYGYVPGRAAIGWDHLPSGSEVAAHEWGHNFGRNHSPCGVSGDPAYPYAGGVIGQWGWNSATNTLVAPTATDLMGYCDNTWVSDFSWNGVLQHRAANGGMGVAGYGASATARPTDALLVWGRIVDGVITLEPAFSITAPVTTLPAASSHRLELLDANGATLRTQPLALSTVDHVQGHVVQQFAVAVPAGTDLTDRLDAIRIVDARAPLRAAFRRGARLGTGVMTMIKDAASGQVIGFSRQPAQDIRTTGRISGRAVQLIESDGVRSRVVR